MYSPILSGRGLHHLPAGVGYSPILSGRGMGMGMGTSYSPIVSGRGLPHRWLGIRPHAQHGHGALAIAREKMPGKKVLEAGKQLAAAKNLIVDETMHEMINPLTTLVMEEHDGIVVMRARGRPARSKGQMPSGGKVVSLPHEKAGQKHTQKGLQALAAAQRGSGLYF